MKQVGRVGFGLMAMILLAGGLAAKTLPNVIIISVDALRPDHISYFGYPRPITPNIDRIAKSGVIFRDATTTIPLTNPAQATLFTSRSISQTGVNRNGIPLLPGNRTLAEILKEKGYHTSAVVSCWAAYHNRSGLERGFEHYRDFGTGLMLELDAGLVTQRALKLVESEIQEPFFLFVDYSEPHQPHDPYPAMGNQAIRLDDDDRPAVQKNYDSEVAYADYWIGVLLSGLEARGWLQNSLLIIMSDHGEGLGEKNYIGHGRKLYEHILRISLVISGPELPKGTQVQAPISMLDLAPTILSYLGLEPLSEMEGRNLLPQINTGQALDPAPMYYETNSIAVLDLPGLKKIGRASPPSAIGLRMGNFKIVHYLKENTWELYDLAQDPEENHNLFNPEDPAHRKLAEQLLENFRTKSAAGKRLELEFRP